MTSFPPELWSGDQAPAVTAQSQKTRGHVGRRRARSCGFAAAVRAMRWTDVDVLLLRAAEDPLVARAVKAWSTTALLLLLPPPPPASGGIAAASTAAPTRTPPRRSKRRRGCRRWRP